jgi:hypothetical protein
MPKVSEKERIAALEARLKQLKVVQQQVETESCGPGRRESVRGGFGQNLLFCTPRPASSRSHSWSVGTAVSSTTPWARVLRSNTCRR